MTIWYKQGVHGDLSNQCRKCLGRIADLNGSRGFDTFVTAKRDGNHMHGTLHENGNAFDMQKGYLSLSDVKAAAGPGFDVVEHRTHYHIEFDPR